MFFCCINSIIIICYMIHLCAKDIYFIDYNNSKVYNFRKTKDTFFDKWSILNKLHLMIIFISTVNYTLTNPILSSFPIFHKNKIHIFQYGHQYLLLVQSHFNRQKNEVAWYQCQHKYIIFKRSQPSLMDYSFLVLLI